MFYTKNAIPERQNLCQAEQKKNEKGSDSTKTKDQDV